MTTKSLISSIVIESASLIKHLCQMLMSVYDVWAVDVVVVMLCGMLKTFPQCTFSLEFPEILRQNLLCYHWLSMSGNSKMMHCGILINTPYWNDWLCMKYACFVWIAFLVFMRESVWSCRASERGWATPVSLDTMLFRYLVKETFM